MKTPVRTARAALLMITALAACTATANAAGPKYDAGYGTVALPTIAGAKNLNPTKCEVLVHDTLGFSGQVSAYEPGARALSTSVQKTFIGLADTHGRTNFPWRTVPSGRGEMILASDFGGDMGFAYVHGLVKERRHARTFIVRKSNAATGKDAKWNDVTLKLPETKLDTFGTAVNVLNLMDGGMLVVIDRVDAQRIYRFTATGKPAKFFGTDGVVTNVPTGPAAWYLPQNAATPLIETWDRKFLIAASGRPGQPTGVAAIGLLKLNPTGSVDEGFADRGLWTPPTTLAEEAPLSGTTKRDAPQTLDVVAETSRHDRMTVLFATKRSNEIGSGTLTAALRLSNSGQITSMTKSFDRGGDGGDGGFPDALPYTFVPTKKGFRYASAWSQFGGGNTVYTYGAIGQLNKLLAPPVKDARFNVKGPFLANDFAATGDGKYIYACGALTKKSAKSKKPWSKYSPALRRFKL